MTEKTQRIAIAESVGWLVNKDGRSGISPINREQGLTNPEICSWILPDYLNDLNAMRDVEKKLKGMQWLNYVDSLLDVCECRTPMIIATAAQRAEAYLRTIGKWEGGVDEPQR